MAHPDSLVSGPPGLVLRSFGGGADGSPRTFSEATLLHERLAAELFDVGGHNAVCDEEVEAALCCAGEGFATARDLLSTEYDGMETTLSGAVDGLYRSGWWRVDGTAWWALLARAAGHDPALGKRSWNDVAARLEAGSVGGTELEALAVDGRRVDPSTLEAWLAPHRPALHRARTRATVAAGPYDGPGAWIEFRRMRGPDPSVAASALPLYRVAETGDAYVTRGLPTGKQHGGRILFEVDSPDERPGDWVLMADGRSVVVSARVVAALRECGATGWSAQPVRFDGGLGDYCHLTGTPAQWEHPKETRRRPYLLQVTGRVGAPDWSAAAPVVLRGQPTSQVVGWSIDPASWDGSDVCAVDGTDEIVVSHRVALAFEAAGCFAHDTEDGGIEDDPESTMVLTPIAQVRVRRSAPQLAAVGFAIPDYLWLREPVESRPTPLR